MNTGRPEAGEYYADLYNRAMNELAALREELAEKEKVWTARFELLCEGAIRPIVLERNDAQQRLAAAEQRNAELVGLLLDTKTVLGNELSYELFRKLSAHMKRIDAALKPTESGASE